VGIIASGSSTKTNGRMRAHKEAVEVSRLGSCDVGDAAGMHGLCRSAQQVAREGQVAVGGAYMAGCVG
jgi:hypothetical protein